MFRLRWLLRRQQWVQEEEFAKMKDRDTHTMENQPLEIIQLAFKSRRLLLFTNRTSKPVNMGDMAVVSVDRGEDMGRVVDKLPPSESNIERVEGNFLRIATDADMETYRSNSEFEKEVLEHCESRVKVRDLEMRLTDCESQLDRNRIRIFFTADQRTDFRGLVRDMASAFRARIEMRQIGVRDDAKYKDGVGICGRQLCCAGFLNEFKSVTLKSVRDQHLSPNPSKVSGACSRLMCCLEYETEFYHKASKTYPRPGLKLKVNGMPATIMEVNIFKETVTLTWDGSGEEEIQSIEDFHRRRTMTSLPAEECSDSTCENCSEAQSKPAPIPKPRPKLRSKLAPKPQSRTEMEPAAPKSASATETDESADKSEKKTRRRGRDRYRRRSSKKEERTSDA